MKNYNFITFIAVAVLFIWIGINSLALNDIYDALSVSNDNTDKKTGTVVGNVGLRSDGVSVNENERIIYPYAGKIITKTFPDDPELREYRLTRRTVTAGPFLFHESANFYTDGYFSEDVKHNAEYTGLLSHGGQELGDALTSIHGVSKATLSYYVVRINKENAHEWKGIEPLILSLLEAFQDEDSSS